MIGKELFKYSLKNIWNRKLRSFLTILSIFVGITTIFIFVSFGWGLYNYTNELTSSSSADKILIQGKGIPGLDNTFKLTEKDLDAVRGVQGVFDATGVYLEIEEIKSDEERIYGFVTGYDPDEPMVMDIFGIDIENGENLESRDNKKVVLGYNYKLDDKIFSKGLEAGDRIKVKDEKLKIKGFFESVGNPQDDSNVYLTNSYMEELYSGENLSYGMIVGKVDVEKMDLVIERIEKELRDIRDIEKGKEDFFVQSFDEMVESYSGAIDVIIGFVILIALVSVVVSAINTSNTMVTSVLERIREIGVMKAIGAKNSEVFQIFLLESSILGLIGGVLGVIFGAGLSLLIKDILENLGYGFLSPYFSYSLFFGCVGFAVITGAISGAWPAREASKINPTEALRYE